MIGYDEIIRQFEMLRSSENIEGMAKFGINTGSAYGISIPKLRGMAKRAGRDHRLAQRLWSSGIHEARILATMVEDPAMATEQNLDRWVSEFDSWDVCDQCCGNLYINMPFAYRKAVEYSGYEKEFVKRAGFVLMAELAVHADGMADEKFTALFPHIRRGSTDDRNFVKKAVNWALRQIGKRNPGLNAAAISLAEEISATDSASAKWIAKDALRELRSEKVQGRLKGT